MHRMPTARLRASNSARLRAMAAEHGRKPGCEQEHRLSMDINKITVLVCLILLRVRIHAFMSLAGVQSCEGRVEVCVQTQHG